jgi:signal transduction histidine kinase
VTTATNPRARQWRHDVRTPLNHVLGYGELVLDSLDGDSAAAAPLQALLGEAQTLLRGLQSGDPHAVPARATSRAACKDDGARAARLQAMQRHARAVHAILAQHGRAELVDDMDKVLSGLQALGRALGQSPVRKTAPKSSRDALPAGSRVAGDDSAATTRPQHAAVPAGHPAGIGTVLVVDDDAGNRELLARAVAALGHRALQADDGAAALATLREGAVDLMLLDLRMPGMDGHAVLRALHADESLRALPVLVVSGDDDRETALRCIEAGAVDYLPKPAEPAILRARIGACLAAKRLHDQAAQLHAQRAAMLAGISHDLRQPLQAVRMYGDTLRQRLNGSGEDLLMMQLQAVDVAVEMLDRFADFAAIQQGRLRVSPGIFDLRALLCEVAHRAEATFPDSGIAVIVRGQSAWVDSDRSLIGRIVQNLVGNAARCVAAASRARRPRVVIALRRRPACIDIDIVDNGPGIRSEDQQRIFGPYVQLRSGGSRGLGLAIVHGLCEQLGLTVDLAGSRIDRGSHFRVSIPGRMVRTCPDGSDIPAAGSTPHRLQGQLVAILDDDKASLDALGAALISLGACTLTASTTSAMQQALDAAMRFPDALVFDQDLADGELGTQFVERLRRQWDEVIPAVIVTGRDTGIGRLPDRCILIKKPAGLAEVSRAIERLISRREP